MRRTPILVFLGLTIGVLTAAEPPMAQISNGQVRVKLYLPDAKTGFYRATRFDWSGVVASLDYKGHNYYGPWFQKIDPNVSDVGYEGKAVVSVPGTAMVGLAARGKSSCFQTRSGGPEKAPQTRKSS